MVIQNNAVGVTGHGEEDCYRDDPASKNKINSEQTA